MAAGVKASLCAYPVTVCPEIAHLSPVAVTASVDSPCEEALTASRAVGSGGCGHKFPRVSVTFPGRGCTTPTFSAASQGRIFALDRGPAERRELEPRWRLAAGLAGLCHDAGKPVSDLSVSDREGRTIWRPLLGSLADWAADNGVDRYFLRWRERRHTRHETFGLLVVERVLTPEVTSWLVDADPEIMQGLLSAVARIDDGAVLGGLVMEADQASVERDLRENRIDPAATSLGVPVDRYLLDAMRRLARGGRWQINVPGARLWMLAEGLHLVWPAGAEDMVALLAADRVPGIPRDPDTLADILLERGLAVPRQAGDRAQRYWRLAPAPLTRDGQVVTLTMLRLASPDLVLAGAQPAPVKAVLASEPTGQEAAEPELLERQAGEKVIATAARDAASGATPSREEAPPSLPAPSELQDIQSLAPQVLDRLPPTPDVPLQAFGTPAVSETDPDSQRAEAAARAATWLRSRGAGGEDLACPRGSRYQRRERLESPNPEERRAGPRAVPGWARGSRYLTTGEAGRFGQ
jgi:conjugal transfer pilus assembly protein TraI